jgi:hypothetical protein
MEFVVKTRGQKEKEAVAEVVPPTEKKSKAKKAVAMPFQFLEEAVADPQPMKKSKAKAEAVAEAVADFPSSANFSSQAQDSSSDYGSISSDEHAPGLSRSLSGSTSFGPKTKQAGFVDENRIFMNDFEYDNKNYKITIPPKVPELLKKANRMSPLLIDHLAKGMGSEIVTRRKKGTTGAKTARVRAVTAPKLLKQMKKDLEEEGGEVVYAWMLIAEKKNSTYHYYLLSNKVKSRLEFGTKHFMLEKKYKAETGKAPYRIYLTGEFRVRPGKLEYNLMSGTYMKSKMENLTPVQTEPIEQRFTKALGEYFSKMEVVRLPDDQSFIPLPSRDKILTQKEWDYVQDLFGNFTKEQSKIQQENEEKLLERMNRMNAFFNNLGSKKPK